MEVLKVVAEGPTTSFRYPHFMHGIHPSFEMPPPSTIYGHICSTLGEWVQPEGIEFGYHFSHAGQFDDIEHIHLLTTAGGVLPGTTLRKVMKGEVNPFKRALLFQPRLTLYINRPEWAAAFRSPRYPVALGRSQDLMTYTSVQVVDLVEAGLAYFEHTLAPYRMAIHVARGYVVLMPRYLDYDAARAPIFARYVVLTRRLHSDELIEFEGVRPDQTFWTDPSTPLHRLGHRGVFFHTFVGEYDDRPRVAGLA